MAVPGSIKSLPFMGWNQWEQLHEMGTIFNDVVMYQDFGTTKEGERFKRVEVDYATGTFSAYDEKGNVVHHFDISLKANDFSPNRF